MSLNWKFQPRLGNRPYNLKLFLAISLFLHWAVFLGLETYWRQIVNDPLLPSKDALLPVKFIQVPADKLAGKPPRDAKAKASTNSTSGGEARPELPPHQVPPQQDQLPPPQDSTDDNQDVTPPMARIRPKLPRHQVSPQQHQLAPPQDSEPLTDDNPVSPPVARMPQHEASSRRSSRQNASLLGGPLRATGEFMGDRRAQLSNGFGLGSDSAGADGGQRFDLNPYLERLRKQVKQQWHPVLSHSSQHTIIGFSISRTGQVSELRILNPSGSALTDQEELQAIQRAAPFAPLPEGYPASELYIRFNFNQIEY